MRCNSCSLVIDGINRGYTARSIIRQMEKAMIPVKWVDAKCLTLKTQPDLYALDGRRLTEVIELSALTEVVKGLQRINEDMLAAGFDEPTDAQRLLAQLEGHTKGGGDE